MVCVNAAHTTRASARPGEGGGVLLRQQENWRRPKIGGAPTGLKVDPHKGLRSPLAMDGGVREG